MYRTYLFLVFLLNVLPVVDGSPPHIYSPVSPSQSSGSKTSGKNINDNKNKTKGKIIFVSFLLSLIFLLPLKFEASRYYTLVQCVV